MQFNHIQGGQYAREVIETLGRGEPFRGAPYNNILLSGATPDIIDTYDPTIASVGKYATLYWPGGSPDHGGALETVGWEKPLPPLEKGAEVVRIRQAIISAHIGEVALARIPADFYAAWDDIDTAYAPEGPLPAIESICMAYKLPLAVCFTSEVTNRNTDTRMMHLFYPNMLRPQHALKQLQTAMRQMIEAEDPHQV